MGKLADKRRDRPKVAGSAYRALEILELFSIEHTPLSVGKVSTKLGYPQSSASLLLGQLTTLGYLQHDRDTRTYFPSLRVMFLGLWMHHQLMNDQSLHEIMDELAKRSNKIVRLGMQNGTNVQYVRTEVGHSFHLDLQPGQLRPLCRTSVGKILLSLKDDEEISRIARYINATESTAKQSPIDIEKLLIEMHECRITGYAQSIDEVVEGTSAIAKIVPGKLANLPPLAISVCLPTAKLEALRGKTIELMDEVIGKDRNSSQPSLLA